MEELIRSLKGKKVDVRCVTSVGFRGELAEANAGVMHIKDDAEDIMVYVSIDKVISISEVNSSHSRPGFIA